MSLEEAVAHATSRAARRLGLTDRGVVGETFWADLVVFDPVTIGSPATYDEPTLRPHGIRHVFVNDELTLRHGRRTEALPGRGVRRENATMTVGLIAESFELVKPGRRSGSRLGPE